MNFFYKESKYTIVFFFFFFFFLGGGGGGGGGDGGIDGRTDPNQFATCPPQGQQLCKIILKSMH